MINLDMVSILLRSTSGGVLAGNPDEDELEVESGDVTVGRARAKRDLMQFIA